MEDKIKQALDAIRPSLQNDGGDIELVAIEGKNVKVRLHGSCAHCAFQQYTLKNGVERYLQAYIDDGITVENVTEGAMEPEDVE